MQNQGDRVTLTTKSRSGITMGEGHVGIKTVLLTALATVIVSFVAVNMFIIPSLVSKKDFTTNIAGMNELITKFKTDLTQTVTATQNTMNALPASIMSQVTTSINQGLSSINAQLATMQSQVTSMTATVNSASTKVDQANASITTLRGEVNALTTKVTADETTITALTTRIATLESKLATTTNTTSGGTISTGDIKVVATVLEEGVQNSADNSTYAQIKMTITNNTANNFEDIIINTLITIDDSDYTLTPTLSGTSWGGWYVKDWQYGDLEVRSKIGYILNAGEVKRIYLNITSYGRVTNTVTGARAKTITDISNSDIVIRTYSIK